MGSDRIGLAGQTPEQLPDVVELPAPTAWPIVLAFGIALLFTGLVTTSAVTILGAILAVCGCVGWFRNVLPHEQHETVPLLEPAALIASRRPQVLREKWVTPELHRARLPLETYPFSAGIKGGLAGSVAMAVLAAIFGIVSGHGVWYPINLLAAGFFPERITTEQIATFHLDSLIVASIVHLISSFAVGLLYAATLPMVPRRPILFGGLIAPILWSGLLHSVLEVLNPVLNQRIEWFWFILSQIGFGVVAGIVVSKQERIRTWQHIPLGVRVGIETPGAIDEKTGENPPQ
jgi:hypothetical protein